MFTDSGNLILFKIVPRFIETTTEGWVFICSWVTGETDVFRKHTKAEKKTNRKKNNLEEKDNTNNKRKFPRKSAIINIFLVIKEMILYL